METKLIALGFVLTYSNTAIITEHTKFVLAEEKMSGREGDSVERLRRGPTRAGGRAWDESRGEKV